MKKQDLDNWIDAKKRHRLSDVQVQMARELGMNPKKLGKIDNHKQERWKAPLPVFIEELYFKRFKRERPLTVLKLVQTPKETRSRDKASAGPNPVNDDGSASLSPGADPASQPEEEG